MHNPLSTHDGLRPESLALSLVERPLAGMINLRAAPDPAFCKRAGKLIGLPLPTVPNRFFANNDAQCIWQGPDEWLVVVADGRQSALAEQLDRALADGHHAVTDVTGNRIVFRLSGNNAITLLSSGCSLDFAAPSVPVGTAAQTILARTPVTILRIDDTPTFDIHARRSYRIWLRDWLLHAAGSADMP